MDNDYYGISKVNASDYVKHSGIRTKIIKTSIIGHELNTSNSLLDWFLNSKESVSGYTKAMWNGNTTLEWAKTCVDLMKNWNSYPIENVIQSNCISKFSLLQEISKVYEKEIEIKSNESVVANKCLVGGIQTSSISVQLKELRDFYGY